MPIDPLEAWKLRSAWQDNPDELSALFDELCAACAPASHYEISRLKDSLFYLQEARRDRHIVELIEETLIIDLKNHWWDFQENDVKELIPKLASAPAAIVKQLKGCPLGLHWLIDCWVQLESLIVRESVPSRPGYDQGITRKAEDSSRQHLTRGETERLTRVYGLLAHDDPTEAAILAFYADTSLLPDGAKHLSAPSLPPRPQCRQRVRSVIERELPPLRAYVKRMLRELYDPEFEAHLERLFSSSMDRTYFLGLKRENDKSFRRIYNACKKKQTRRKGFALAYPLLAAELEATRPKPRVDRGAA